MHKNWLRFGIFITLFFSLFSLVNTVFELHSVGSWIDYYKLPENSLDVLFIGNSHNINGFQPVVIDDILQINSFVLGVGGEDARIIYYELKEALKYQKPRVVVLETFPLELTDVILPSLIFAFVDPGPWTIEKGAIETHYLPVDMWYTVFPALRTRFDWNHPGELSIKIKNLLAENKKTIDSQRGYAAALMLLPKEVYDSADTLPDPPRNDSTLNNLIYLQKINNLCKKNNIELVLASLPVRKITGYAFRFYKPLDFAGYAKANNIDLISFDGIDFNELHFCDSNHLNSFGSLFVSIDIAKELSTSLNLPINQEKLEDYQSFLFSNYALSRNGNHYFFKLLPESDPSTLQYKMRVFEYELNQDLIVTDWQNSSEFEFEFEPIDHQTLYNIEVQVRKPNSDYKIVGRYLINLEDQ